MRDQIYSPDTSEQEAPTNDVTTTPTEAANSTEDGCDQTPTGPFCQRATLSAREKFLAVAVASLATFISPISASIYYPSVEALTRDLHVSNSMINYTNTSFKLFQGIAPIVTGGLSDRMGRRAVLIPALIFYIATNVGLALQCNFTALIILRSLQSISSSTISIVGTATTADVVTRSERGKYMAYTIIGATVGPALGPLIGGILSHYLGWRSSFWFLVIFAGLILSLTVVFLPETFHRSANLPKWMRSAGGTESPGAPNIQHSNQSFDRPKSYLSPWATIKLLWEKETACIVFFSAVMYACYLSITTTLPFELQSHYHYDSLQVGICYLPYGLGSLTSRWTAGSLSDWNLRRLVRRLKYHTNDEVERHSRDLPFEKARLQITFPLAYFTALFVVIYSWALQYTLHPSVPLIMLFLIGHGMAGVTSTLTTLIIDCHTEKPATASAAANLVRCLLGAGANASALPLINTISVGWTGSLFAFICIVSTPLIWVVYALGHKWRREGQIAL